MRLYPFRALLKGFGTIASSDRSASSGRASTLSQAYDGRLARNRYHRGHFDADGTRRHRDCPAERPSGDIRLLRNLCILRQPLEHGRARLADVLDTSGGEGQSGRIDEAVVTFFAAPNSYTTQDLVEIAAHGSPVVLDLLLRRAMDLGARLAEPGEFTQRAFLAGRLDLTQAEAVRDLIEAQTLTQARQAASQMGGALSRRVAPIKQVVS